MHQRVHIVSILLFSCKLVF